jgi:hypothetical protein
LLKELVFLLCIIQLLSELVNILPLHLDLFLSHLLHLHVVHLAVCIAILAVLEHLGLIGAHFGLLSLTLLFGLQLLDLDSEIGNHLNKLDIFSHDIHVVLLMDLLLLFQSLFQRVLGVIKVAFLVLVLLLDIWIDFYVLHLLVLDEVVKVLIDHSLELIEVINVLSDPVDSVLETLDFDIISPDLCSIFLDQLLHVLLTSSQVINNVT